jgi:hypothetical protein
MLAPLAVMLMLTACFCAGLVCGMAWAYCRSGHEPVLLPRQDAMPRPPLLHAAPGANRSPYAPKKPQAITTSVEVERIMRWIKNPPTIPPPPERKTTGHLPSIDWGARR